MYWMSLLKVSPVLLIWFIKILLKLLMHDKLNHQFLHDVYSWNITVIQALTPPSRKQLHHSAGAYTNRKYFTLENCMSLSFRLIRKSEYFHSIQQRGSFHYTYPWIIIMIIIACILKLYKRNTIILCLFYLNVWTPVLNVAHTQ